MTCASEQDIEDADTELKERIEYCLDVIDWEDPRDGGVVEPVVTMKWIPKISPFPAHMITHFEGRSIRRS